MRIAFLLIVLVVGGSRSESATVVALTGVTSPDPSSPELKVKSIANASVSSNGRVAFTGELIGPDVSSSRNDALFSYDGDVVLEARETEPVPGLAEGETFAGFSRPAINDRGEIAYHGVLRSLAEGNLQYAAKVDDAGFALLAKQGDQAVGAALGDAYTFLTTEPVINESGGVAFFSYTNQSRGIWALRDGVVEKIALRGEESPVGDEWRDLAAVASSSTPRRLALNDAGEVAFLASFTDSGWPVPRQGVFVDSGVGPQALVLTEASSFNEETGFDGLYRGFTEPAPSLNDSGQLAFTGGFAQSRSPLVAYNGVWVADGTHVDLVARSGVPAPGVPGGEFVLTPGGAPRRPEINNEGYVAFSGRVDVDGDARIGIWSDRGGSLELIAVEEATAPGFPADWTFRGLSHRPIVFGEDGTVAFAATTDPTVDLRNYQFREVWVARPEQEAAFFVGIGSLLDIDPDPLSIDLRTVDRIEDLDALQGVFELTDTGEMLMNVGFEDGSEALILFDTAASPALHGDYNADGVVDAADYTVWRDAFSGVAVGMVADGDRNGVVDVGDLEVWRRTYGQVVAVPASGPVGTEVPEPSSFLLVSGAALAFVAWFNARTH